MLSRSDCLALLPCTRSHFRSVKRLSVLEEDVGRLVTVTGYHSVGVLRSYGPVRTVGEHVLSSLITCAFN